MDLFCLETTETPFFQNYLEDVFTNWQGIFLMSIFYDKPLSVSPNMQLILYIVCVWLQDEKVKFVNGCDEVLSHLIFAGSDIILCQSFHDPVLQVPVSILSHIFISSLICCPYSFIIQIYVAKGFKIWSCSNCIKLLPWQLQVVLLPNENLESQSSFVLYVLKG